jgi:hypothetical protein
MSNGFTVEEKGKLIESVVTNMFLASGLKIFANGAEMKHQDFYNYFMERKKLGLVKKYDPRLRQLLSIPDFLLENLKIEYDFVEVKFRSIHHLKGGDLIEQINLIKHFNQCRKVWKPEIILVTSESLDTYGMFSVISYPYYEKIEGKTRLFIRKITDIKKWGINPAIVKSYEDIVTQMLGS